jgi:hypothetical protein
MTPEQIRDAWNAQSDEYNQWDNLCWREIVEWTLQCVQDKQRQWVGLTNEEIEAVMHGSVEGERMLPYQFARAIEAKLKAKNEAP